MVDSHDRSDSGRFPRSRASDSPLTGISPVPVLFCVTCDEQFSALDLALFRYDWKSGRCSSCLQSDYDRSPKRSCFGKAELYDPDSAECSRLCPDRVSCPEWIGGKMSKLIRYTEAMRQNAVRLYRAKGAEERRRRVREAKHPFPQKGSIIRVIWDKAEQGTTVEQIQKLCSDIGSDFRYYMRVLRRECANGRKWEFIEDENAFRVRLLPD